nr:uncharacterized protein CI109_001493 [Kwoniella shandongensis]KAA5530089.1 hypothetical protein CI109_001493 [Kwoniella shandongensis]
MALALPTPQGLSSIHALDSSPSPDIATIYADLASSVQQGDLMGLSTVNLQSITLGSDSLGRRITKRGHRIMIEEPRDTGRQWGGAEEMDDESDEPYWG